MSQIQIATLDFLSHLSENNNREWFAENRALYDVALANVQGFLDALTARMNQGDDVDRARLFRIYRDVRFSKDKLPYHTRFGMSLARRKPLLRGGYMVKITPSGTTVAAGFWAPNAGDLGVVRSQIDLDPDRFRQAAEDPVLLETFGPLRGSGLKTAPRGFRQDHPDIELLRRKQYLFSRPFEPVETTSADFLDEVVFTFRSVRPFFDYMSEIFSHDPNGVALF